MPAPSLAADLSLAQALRQRQTIREFADDRLTTQELSNLLWAACGINRDDGPFGVRGRTAASASNSQEIELFVMMEEGAYCYNASAHKLIPVATGDLRALAIGKGQRQSGHKAPVRLVFVANIGRLEHSAGFDEPGLHDAERQKAYYYVDTGLIAGNVYLYAAGAGLAAWFHNCDHGELPGRLGLGPDQIALFAQTVGHPLCPS